MTTEGQLWHLVEAKRDDGAPTMFRIRELDPQKQLDRIFVVEVPYPADDASRLPNASAYRRLASFEQDWLLPAAGTHGWEFVGSKTEDGSFFLYLYGAGDPNDLVAKLSPFDANLGFYDDSDPEWLEYGTLRELLDQAKAIPKQIKPQMTTAHKPVGKAKGKAKAKAATKAKPATKAKAKAKPAAKAKPKKQKAKPKAKGRR